MYTEKMGKGFLCKSGKKGAVGNAEKIPTYGTGLGANGRPATEANTCRDHGGDGEEKKKEVSGSAFRSTRLPHPKIVWWVDNSTKLYRGQGMKK